MSEACFQDFYPDSLAHCFGCGRLNEKGHRIQSRWEGEESVCRFTPAPEHMAVPGFVYGGLLASLIDCHGTGTAAAAAYRAEARPMDSDPPRRFLTASLKVDYLAPTPLGPELELRGRVAELKGRKVIVDIELSAAGRVTARGQVVAVQVPPAMLEELAGGA
jgi:acyl-coenzyme A thioesterase PaaI-like protein